jgi:hypothetical protein
MNCWLKADAPGQFPLRCVGACCGAATAAGADLVDEKTVGLGPGDGLRRTVVLTRAGAGAARLGAGAACTRGGLAVVAIVGIGARGVVVARGAGFGARTTFFGAGLVDEKTVGLGPGDGLRRTVVLMLAGADAARLGAGAACTRVGLAVVAIVRTGARGVVVARGAGFGAGFGARTTFFGAGFAAGAGVICTTLGTALGCAAGAVATWPVDGRALQITLRSRETRGTHVTLPSIPARIYTQPRLSTY